MRHQWPFDRRRLLGGSIACAAALGLPALVRALAAEMPPTPSQTAGPFYPSSFPADADADLVHVAGQPEQAKGSVTEITGRILDRTGRPLQSARVEIWQCDANGRYHHVRGDGRDRPLDNRFQGFGQAVADAGGGYRFLTIRPVPYPGRTPHIHFAVSANGFGRFTTQMYVAGDPGNDRDQLLMSIRDPAARARLIVPLQAAPNVAPGALAGRFDIVLG